MPALDNAYSRLVALLKILLPLIALGILATLFLFSRTVDPTRSIPFADTDVQELAREQRIGGLTFSGVTDDGAAITLSAESTGPDPGNAQLVRSREITARITTPAGEDIEVTAAKGTFDAEGRTARLEEGVVVTTSAGYRIETGPITADLENSRLEAEGKVEATGPLGRLTAGRMELTQQAENGPGGDYLLVFKNGVKLVYEPKR